MARVLVMLVLTSAVVGCASAGPRPAAAEETPAESLVASEPSAKVLYQLLIGEFAGKRDDLRGAAEAYAKAAAISERPAVAARAARLAVYAGDGELARRGARRWLALDSDALEAKRILGLVALRSGAGAEAKEWFLQSLPEASAGRDEALSQIGGLLARQTDQEAALEVAAAIAGALPDSRMAQFLEAQMALRAAYPERAKAAAERAIAIDEGWRPARVLRVEAMLEQGQTEAALDALQNLIAERPEDFELRLQYARTLANVARIRAALEEFERLIERRPDDQRALMAGGVLALQLEELEKAETWFSQLLEGGQRGDAARYYLGRVAELRERNAEALDYYSAAGGEYRDEAALRIAFVLAADGRLREARERLQRLREDRPQSAVRAFLAESELLRQRDRLEDSRALLARALRANPEQPDLLYGRAMTLVAMDRIDAAEADFRAVIEQEPDNANALNALGYTLVDETERLAEGAKLVERAYSLSPNDPAIIDSMGWVAYRQGRLEEAVGYLRKAYELGPQGEIAAHLGEVLWKMDRREEAREVWNRALARFPDSEILQRTMDRLL